MSEYLFHRIRIVEMDGIPEYSGKEGICTSIDSFGQLHGTWGGIPIMPLHDQFVVIAPPMDPFTDDPDGEAVEEPAGDAYTNLDLLEDESKNIKAANEKARHIRALLCTKYRNKYGACDGCPFGEYTDGAKDDGRGWRCKATFRALLRWGNAPAKLDKDKSSG